MVGAQHLGRARGSDDRDRGESEAQFVADELSLVIQLGDVDLLVQRIAIHEPTRRYPGPSRQALMSVSSVVTRVLYLA